MTSPNGSRGPGGVGYDINCGVRLVRTNLTLDGARSLILPLVNQQMRDIPVGVELGGSRVFSPAELRQLMQEGVPWLERRGLATADDVAHHRQARGSRGGRHHEGGLRAPQGGDMGRASWVLVGGPRSMERSFGTTCHGAALVANGGLQGRGCGGGGCDPSRGAVAQGRPAHAAGRDQALAGQRPGTGCLAGHHAAPRGGTS